MKSKADIGLCAALFATVFLTIFHYTLPNMASPYIVSSLGGSESIAKYTISFFSIGNALGIPLGPHLYEKYGRRPLMAICLLLFALFTWGCAAAPNFSVFIFLRILQGIACGPFFALSRSLFLDCVCEEHKRFFAPVVLAIFMLGPVVGACFGGWIAYDYEWRLSFYLTLPPILFLLAYLWVRLKEYPPPLSTTSFNWISYLSFAIGILFLSTALITGQELDWFRSPFINALFIVGGVSFCFFILWELVHPQPVFELRLLKNPVFSYALFNLGILFGVYFGMIILLALWLTLYVNYTPIWIGILIGTMAVIALLPLLFFYKIFGRFDTRKMLLVSLVFFALSNFYTATFDVEVDMRHVALSRILAGCAIGFFLPPLFRLSFATFSEEKSIHVLTLFQAVRATFSGLGTAIFVTLWERREVFFHERLGEKLTSFSSTTAAFFDKVARYEVDGMRAKALLSEALDRQAISLALNDSFYLMGWLMIALILLMLCTLGLKKERFHP